MQQKLNENSISTIQATLLNYVGSISPDEELDITFSSSDNGRINSIQFECKKKSKNPDLIRVIDLKNNVISVNASPNPSKT